MSGASELDIKEKEILIGIIQNLRFSNLIGLIEARDWIQSIFPEFGLVRDSESDELFLKMARAQLGVDEK